MDLISKAAFAVEMEIRYCAPCRKDGNNCNGLACRACWVDDMVSEVEQFETVDAEPVRHGKWITKSAWHTECSECGYVLEVIVAEKNYCSRCGAKMDAEVDNNGTY